MGMLEMDYLEFDACGVTFKETHANFKITAYIKCKFRNLIMAYKNIKLFFGKLLEEAIQ